ncbi:small ribosomal subunit protein mS26 [Salarias fasciatus]|uniref:Small ribosomal subunit protein mS26 n=1 Tax=Salarias fasciatus TaxID=181472 RepID=A0A672FK46_SALFA|nr:28S ribosomal protein S26, mitochondrial [Salarias fasciatus]
MFQVSRGTGFRAARLLAGRSPVLLDSVRGRKSRTDPVAKSKEGRVKVPPPVDPVEMVVLKERFSEYQMILRALRMQFKEEVLRRKYEEETGSQAEERARQEAEEHRALMAWNREENRRQLSSRILRLQRGEEEEQQRREEAALQQQQQQQDFILEKEREILRLQEEAKTFITLENLDQRIQQALDQPKNYNYAIDREGRVAKQTVLQ